MNKLPTTHLINLTLCLLCENIIQNYYMYNVPHIVIIVGCGTKMQLVGGITTVYHSGLCEFYFALNELLHLGKFT